LLKENDGVKEYPDKSLKKARKGKNQRAEMGQ